MRNERLKIRCIRQISSIWITELAWSWRKPQASPRRNTSLLSFNDFIASFSVSCFNLTRITINQQTETDRKWLFCAMTCLPGFLFRLFLAGPVASKFSWHEQSGATINSCNKILRCVCFYFNSQVMSAPAMSLGPKSWPFERVSAHCRVCQAVCYATWEQCVCRENLTLCVNLAFFEIHGPFAWMAQCFVWCLVETTMMPWCQGAHCT